MSDIQSSSPLSSPTIGYGLSVPANQQQSTGITQPTWMQQRLQERRRKQEEHNSKKEMAGSLAEGITLPPTPVLLIALGVVSSCY